MNYFFLIEQKLKGKPDTELILVDTFEEKKIGTIVIFFFSLFSNLFQHFVSLSLIDLMMSFFLIENGFQ